MSGLDGGLKLKDGWSKREGGLGVSGSIRFSVTGSAVLLGKLLNLDPGELNLCVWGVTGLLDGPGLKLCLLSGVGL